MKPVSYLIIFLLFLSMPSYAQQTFSITGIVKDKKGESLPGAGVYVSGYKIATATNHTGSYTLGSLKPGNYDILVQMVGYLPYSKNVIISDKSVTLNVILEESVTQLNEVTIRPDPNREYYLKIFKENFIGTTPNALQCTIMNPQVLNINYDKSDNLLTVQTNEFLIIENKALGYRIKYLLNDFEYNFKTRIIYYAGFPHFEDLNGSNSKKKRWAKNRLTAYNGSIQHLFRSLYNNTSDQEGFIIYKYIRIPNPDRLNDSTINANANRLLKKQKSIGSISIMIGGSQDSLSYWLKQKNMPKTIATLNRQKVQTDTLVHTVNQDLKKINFIDALYVIYTKEKESISYSNRIGLSISRPLDIPDYQISLIDIQIAPVYFYANGAVYNTRSMLFSGYFSWEKVADLVPMDYIPETPK